MGDSQKILLPDIGDFSGVEVIEILVQEGQQIEQDQSLITLESDKASMEIPSPNAGTVVRLAIQVGDRLSEGDLILELQPASDADPLPEPPEPMAEELETSDQPVIGKSQQPVLRPGDKQPAPPPIAPLDQPPGKKPHASPAVRRFARELGADLGLISGSGVKGRITKADVQAFIKKALSGGAMPQPTGVGLQIPGAPDIDFSKFGPVQHQELGRIKKISGAHLHRCWLTVPHVTQFDEADITELEAFRQAQKRSAEQKGVRLTMLAFVLKACATALRAMPHFNSSLSADGQTLILKDYVHIGVAVDTPNGLMVPVLRDVDRKGIYELASELIEVSARARDSKLSPSDLQGGCFSISSLGGIGGTAFTPIVNNPEVAILGLSRAATKPVWDGQSFQPRLLLPLSLSYDHRVIDGADGARFSRLLTDLLGDIRRLLL
jgi:pyruvate dehydrogenase E2 component (dihydrolipoamide acetyltransferase)